jgi:steroid delta-isomerase-like uncharacterized protein
LRNGAEIITRRQCRAIRADIAIAVTRRQTKRGATILTIREQKGEASMSEQNKVIARRLREECFSTGDMRLADQLLDENYVYHGPSILEEVKGREAFKQVVAGFRAALPDLRETVEDQIAEGDKVVTRFVSRGTHQGELMGAPPTGKQITIRGTDISRVRDGKIVEGWVMFDALAMMQQVGLVQAFAG